MGVRLLELQNETDAVQACAAVGRGGDPNLRGWAALVPREAAALVEGLRDAGLAVLGGDRGALAVGTLSQIGTAARNLGDSLDQEPARNVAHELAARAANVETRPVWRLPRSVLPERRTLVMGIVNVTPDSFSDGGRYLAPAAAVEHGLRLAAEGADLLDVGGESTRPGAVEVNVRDERARVEPVVRELCRRAKVPVSVDTTKSEVAEAAIGAGAEIVNDVSALRRDPDMGATVARAGAALVLMHMRGTPADMQQRARYEDLSGEVQDELIEALERACAAGVPEERIALDPGLGFAKSAEHNLLLLRRLRELAQLGRPLLVGASRKAFIGKTSGRPPAERTLGSVAAAVIAAMNGASIVRVHDVAATREALVLADAVRESNG